MAEDTLSRNLLAGVLGFLLSLILVGLLRVLAKRLGVFALPGVRQSHEGVIPTGGGLGMMLALSASSWIVQPWFSSEPLWLDYVIPSAIVLAVLGWMDDRKTTSPLLRFLVQLTVSFGLLVLLRQSGLHLAWPVFALGGIAMTWVMNMYNFMDGSHGMAGFQGVFAAGVVVWLSLDAGQLGLAMAAMLTAACCAGFLPWNFPKARIFMGDAGSVPLGFVLGSLLLWALKESVLSLPMAALVLAVFLADSGLTLLRRVIRKERWYTPHKQHVYQRLIAHGWPHGRVLLVYQAINIVVIMPALLLAKIYPGHAWPIAAVVALLLTASWYAAPLRLEVRT